MGRTVAVPLLAKRLGIVTKSVRCMAYWNKDWKPGPYPRTPKERAAAAKKYNMRVEDYEPYPDDGFGYGDYPKLPRIADEAKDPYQPYDLPNNRRFFGEPVHVDADAMTEDRWNPTRTYRFTMNQQKLWFLAVMGGFWAVYLLGWKYTIFNPVLPKHYSNDGKKHYTFEPAD
ncbi:NADH dehydrogenase [ubiquinone] 1 beta subcomplex subunit 8, mitochondrial [Lamellibrachia satsuma]|nr:NADH dehydrogenase [ubiquinone] 1 beta subcomplex subunit 8, mitochondrial [Lamellibrachia satsuma]